MATGAENQAEQSRDGYYRSSDVRYGARCPGVVELTFTDGKHYIALTGMIVNLSVTGCLFSNDRLPWTGMDAEGALDSVFDVIHRRCRVYIPWINVNSTARIRRIGCFIIGTEFDQPLEEPLVRSAARLEPNRKRRFSPKAPGRYNRVLPVRRA